MAERCGLFVIIALGESILVMGATFSGLDWTWTVLAAFLASFVGSVTMWWLYFNATAAFGSRAISTSSDPGRLARSAYTYYHLPIVAGIIVTAVADELVLAHPGGHAEGATVAAILGGPALYLAGVALFKWSITGRVSLPHCLGIMLLAILAATSAALSPLALSRRIDHRSDRDRGMGYHRRQAVLRPGRGSGPRHRVGVHRNRAERARETDCHRECAAEFLLGEIGQAGPSGRPQPGFRSDHQEVAMLEVEVRVEMGELDRCDRMLVAVGIV